MKKIRYYGVELSITDDLRLDFDNKETFDRYVNVKAIGKLCQGILNDNEAPIFKIQNYDLKDLNLSLT